MQMSHFILLLKTFSKKKKKKIHGAPSQTAEAGRCGDEQKGMFQEVGVM